MGLEDISDLRARVDKILDALIDKDNRIIRLEHTVKKLEQSMDNLQESHRATARIITRFSEVINNLKEDKK